MTYLEIVITITDPQSFGNLSFGLKEKRYHLFLGHLVLQTNTRLANTSNAHPMIQKGDKMDKIY